MCTENSIRLCCVLQSGAHTLGATEGCAAAPSNPTVWRDRRPDYFIRAASSICPNMIFGRDKTKTRVYRRGTCNYQPPLASSGSNDCAQRGAKFSVMLDVPLATHGFAAGFAAFGIEQYPSPPSSRLGIDSRIMLLEASFQVGRPADIGSAPGSECALAESPWRSASPWPKD